MSALLPSKLRRNARILVLDLGECATVELPIGVPAYSWDKKNQCVNVFVARDCIEQHPGVELHEYSHHAKVTPSALAKGEYKAIELAKTRILEKIVKEEDAVYDRLSKLANHVYVMYRLGCQGEILFHQTKQGGIDMVWWHGLGVFSTDADIEYTDVKLDQTCGIWCWPSVPSRLDRFR